MRIQLDSVVHGAVEMNGYGGDNKVVIGSEKFGYKFVIARNYNSSGNRQGRIEPTVKDASAVSFHVEFFIIVALDFGIRFYFETGRIGM